MDKKQEEITRLFGLIGKNISYSFSVDFFSEKFKSEHINNTAYLNFDINAIEDITQILQKYPKLKGLNVTIPYKKAILPYLDTLNKHAKKIGAVNTLKITKNNQLKGYNTDWYGFKKALQPYLKAHHKKALVLGTGGASNAIIYVLKKLNIPYLRVSRNHFKKKMITYNMLTKDLLQAHHIIINCTPLGTFPAISEKPNIPYDAVTPQHILFDLIYNPTESSFLKAGKAQGAITINGYNMLVYQAEKAWDIWNR